LKLFQYPRAVWINVLIVRQNTLEVNSEVILLNKSLQEQNK
jgi:hypothetical protein